MKCILTNDIHLGVSRNDSIWLEQAKKLFSCIIDECHRKDIYTLCILGDFFHDRKNVGIKTLNTAVDIANNLKDNNIKVIFLVGNHDTFNKTDIEVSPLQIFDEYNNIQIIREPTIIDNVGFSSWTNDIHMDADYLFGHLEINNFPVTNGRVFEKGGYNTSDFSQYKKVITGHFHIPSTRENVTYLGAPYHMTFNDVGSLRGFYFFDDGDLEFIEFDGIKFIYISSEEVPDEKKIEGNIVRLIFEKDYGTIENNKKIELVQKYNPLRFQTDFTMLSKEIDTEENTVQVNTLKSNKEMLFDYIDIGKHPDYINPKKMKDIINTLLED